MSVDFQKHWGTYAAEPDRAPLVWAAGQPEPHPGLEQAPFRCGQASSSSGTAQARPLGGSGRPHWSGGDHVGGRKPRRGGGGGAGAGPAASGFLLEPVAGAAGGPGHVMPGRARAGRRIQWQPAGAAAAGVAAAAAGTASSARVRPRLRLPRHGPRRPLAALRAPSRLGAAAAAVPGRVPGARG